jgi:hypothetical protein
LQDVAADHALDAFGGADHVGHFHRIDLNRAALWEYQADTVHIALIHQPGRRRDCYRPQWLQAEAGRDAFLDVGMQGGRVDFRSSMPAVYLTPSPNLLSQPGLLRVMPTEPSEYIC